MKKIAALLLVFCFCIPWTMTDAAEPEGKAVFEAGQADSQGFFDVTLTLYNVRFNVFAFGVCYDPDTVRAVDDTGKAVDSFKGFGQLAETDWLSSIGTTLDTKTGYFEFTGYVNPGQAFKTDNKELVTGVANVGASGVEVFTFHFQKVGTEPVSIQLATTDELPTGGAILEAGESCAATYEVSIPADLGTGGTVTDPGTSGSGTDVEIRPAVTADELVENSIFLQIGNRAAVVRGGVTAIYSGEPDVYAYINGAGRTMVPVRFVAEQLGATVEWDNGVVDIRVGNTVIRMPVGSKEYTVNGVTKTMDTPTVRPAHGRTMVPIRFVAEALGYEVEYDTTYHMAIISSRDWTMGGDTEKTALSQANGLLVLYGGFVL